MLIGALISHQAHTAGDLLDSPNFGARHSSWQRQIAGCLLHVYNESGERESPPLWVRLVRNVLVVHLTDTCRTAVGRGRRCVDECGRSGKLGKRYLTGKEGANLPWNRAWWPDHSEIESRD